MAMTKETSQGHHPAQGHHTKAAEHHEQAMTVQALRPRVVMWRSAQVTFARE